MLSIRNVTYHPELCWSHKRGFSLISEVGSLCIGAAPTVSIHRTGILKDQNWAQQEFHSKPKRFLFNTIIDNYILLGKGDRLLVNIL